MVVLTKEVALKGISSKSPVFRANSQDSAFDERLSRGVTHLHLQNRNIHQIGDLSLFKNLTVLYLYENNLEKVSGLEELLHLEIIHMEKNLLQRIEGFSNCHKLTKLYLSCNKIEVLENLETLPNLVELHIERQRLPQGSQLTFEPKTMTSLSKCLRIIDISENGVQSLEDFKGFSELRVLSALENQISDLEGLCHQISTIPQLQSLDLMGNPASKAPKYRETIIANSPSIELLDGKKVGVLSKAFIGKFEKGRKYFQRTSESFQDFSAGDFGFLQDPLDTLPSRAPSTTYLPPRHLRQK